MNEGMLQGGWAFVGAAYGITWTALVAYGVGLYLRSRRKEGT